MTTPLHGSASPASETTALPALNPATALAYDLTRVSTGALCYALGSCAALAGGGAPPGRIAALVAELKRRGHWDDLANNLGPEQAQGLSLLAMVDNAQRYRGNGQRRDV